MVERKYDSDEIQDNGTANIKGSDWLNAGLFCVTLFVTCRLFKKSFVGGLGASVSIRMDPDQVRCFIGPNLGLN